jgi:hypothetical protein
MALRRYQVGSRIVIDAPIARVYAIASDPQLVPLYAGEVKRIDVIERRSNGSARVRSHLRFFGFTFVFDYRYRYKPGLFYCGVQRGRNVLRGYFAMRFRSAGESTEVEHTEGLISPIPGVARLIGWLYFRLLPSDSIDDELLRLKRLVESAPQLGSA